MKRRFIQCDVFTAVPGRGNGLAVVVDAAELSDADMQGFAAWTNLAETTFLLPPTDAAADYRVRIFTPAREMPFAGHPTLGSCAAWLRTGGVPAEPGLVRQECGVGVVVIDTRGDVPAFVAPPTAVAPLPAESLRAITGALGMDPARVLGSARLDNGPVWRVLALGSAAEVLAVDSSRARWPEFGGIGLIGPHPAGSECDHEVRMLGTSGGMGEDPITGSLNAAIAHWMRDEGRLPSAMVVAQGTAIGRLGRVHVRLAGGEVLIGGETQIMIEGTLDL